MISCKTLPDPLLGKVFNLLSISLQYTLSFEWSGFGLKDLVTVRLKGQNAWNFSLSETGSKCNSVFRHADSNWVIIMELKRKVEYSWACTFWASLCFKWHRGLNWTYVGVRYYKLSIATSVTSTAIFQFLKTKSSICEV